VCSSDLVVLDLPGDGLDLAANIDQLVVNIQHIVGGLRAIHDRLKLRFSRAQIGQAAVQVNVILGHILAGHIVGLDGNRSAFDLFPRFIQPRRRDADGCCGLDNLRARAVGERVGAGTDHPTAHILGHLVDFIQLRLRPAPKKAYTVPIGKKSIKPNFLLLGDPLHTAATGQPDDLPFALYWMELLARLGVLKSSATAAKIWSRLLKDTGKDGVWHPKNLRGLPKATSPWAYHMFPLEGDTKSAESKLTDVTFRMALIARISGMELTSA